VGLAGADAHHAIDSGDEDLAVADLARLGRLQHRIDDLVDERIADRNLDTGLRHEVDHVLGAAIQLGVAALATEALHFRDGHARHTDLGQRGAHVVELERLDNRGDQFHARTPVDELLPAFNSSFRASAPRTRIHAVYAPTRTACSVAAHHSSA